MLGVGPRISGDLAGDSFRTRLLKARNDRLHAYVLDLIFSHCSCSDLASLALVCRSWSSIALDVLWRELDNLEHLLSILNCRWKLINDRELVWSTYPTSTAWTRFWSYADRVRVLLHDDDECWTFGESLEVLHVFLSLQVICNLSRNAQVSGRSAILPSLRKIVWEPSLFAPATQFVYFAPASVQTVGIALQNIRAELIDEHFEMTLGSLSTFLPRLEELRLETLNDVDSETIDLAIDDLVARCHGLKRIHISGPYTTLEIISSFGNLSRLEHFSVGLQSPKTYPELLEFLRNIKSALPPLIGLSIHLLHCRFAIDGDGFRVFQSWKDLEILQITGSSGMTLTEDDVTEMGNFWGGLKILCLGSMGEKFNLPLTIMPVIAHAFPNLVTLALPVNIDLTALKQDKPTWRFKRLNFLAIASDALQSGQVRPIAEFLSAVLPPGISVRMKRESLQMISRKSIHPSCYHAGCSPNWSEVSMWIQTIHRVQEKSVLEIIERIRVGLDNHTVTPDMLTRKGNINSMNSLWHLLGEPSS